MLVKIHTAAKSILNLSRFTKQTIAILVDLSLCVLCTWFAFYLHSIYGKNRTSISF